MMDCWKEEGPLYLLGRIQRIEKPPKKTNPIYKTRNKQVVREVDTIASALVRKQR
jgi:hypothetical protein